MRCCLALLAAVLLRGEGTAPKAGPAEYPVSARWGDATIAAEFMIHSVPGRNQTFFVDDYLVVEVALYPDKLKEAAVASSDFLLRFNGKRTLVTQPAQFVAASLRNPDWERGRQLEVQAGPVILGRPQPVERFPGDPTSRQGRLPEPPRVPSQLPAAGGEPVDAKDVVLEMAFPEGNHKHPVAGYLYFPYKGNLKGLKTIELVVKSAAGEAILKLR